MKKTRQKIALAVLLILLLPFVVLGRPVSAASRSGALTATVSWELSDEGVLTIGGSGEMPDYSCDSYDKNMSPPWAPFACEITEICIGEGITRIGAYSFCYYNSCSETPEYESLQKITFPSSLISVGSDAFFCHYFLDDVRPTLYVPSLKDWGEIEFETDGVCMDFANNQYASPVWMTGTPYIDGKQPSGTIVFPKSLTKVKSCAFDNWTGITEIVLHDGITEIGELAFSAPDLQEINLPDGITDIKMGTFCGCYALTEIDIPNSVRSIGNYAFYACKRLTKITLPTSLRYIGTDVFALCKAMKDIHITDLASYLHIYSADPWQDGYLLQGDLRTPRTLYLNGEKLTDIVIPKEITVIPPYAFYGCDTLTTVTFEDTFELIGESAFADCTALTKVQYVHHGDNIRNAFGHIVQDSAFARCTSLKDIPQVYDYIGEKAFANCTALTEINLHTKYVAPHAFEGCTSLTSAELSLSLQDLAVDKNHSLYALSEVKLWGTEASNAFLEHFTKSGTEGNLTVYTRCEHDWKQKDGSPRATADGCAFDSECTKCQKVKTDLHPHENGDWTVKVEPTETTTGKKERACTLCGIVLETEELDRLAPSAESTDTSDEISREPSVSTASAEISDEPSVPTASASSEPDKTNGVPAWATLLIALLAASCGAGVTYFALQKRRRA